VASFGLIQDIITHFFLKTLSGHLLLQKGMGSHPLQDACHEMALILFTFFYIKMLCTFYYTILL